MDDGPTLINVVEVDVNKCVAVGLYRIIDDLHVVTDFCDWIHKLCVLA
jgi:hypothetical protein